MCENTVALLVLALVGAVLLKRKKAAALRASVAGPVVSAPVTIHVDLESGAPATKGPTATVRVVAECGRCHGCHPTARSLE